MGDSLYYPWMSPQQWHYGNLTHVQVRSILGRMKVCCFFSPASHRKSRPMRGAEEFRKWRVWRAGRESGVWPSAFSPVFTTSQLGLEQTEQLWPEVNVDGDFIKPFLETVLFFCFVYLWGWASLSCIPPCKCPTPLRGLSGSFPKPSGVSYWPLCDRGDPSHLGVVFKCVFLLFPPAPHCCSPNSYSLQPPDLPTPSTIGSLKAGTGPSSFLFPEPRVAPGTMTGWHLFAYLFYFPAPNGECKLREDIAFCQICLHLDPQSLEEWLAHSRC